ncbi:dTDP-Rha--alpha-D-GlcNAc-pyrophosphate polyprenol alpha-3-L-rhamnosyltransferase [Siphonobacter sp. SORGH_AS_0500]|uniref:glycosyltransferase family 2 protein n=1 Tax=Siphonobacter sp. SORGH_AS_0500 TaxID=1864824 RepID=UPI000CC0EAD8|nr:glycosyltransferase family 2 protein [Siphonobacter sp. SORGH_AS_0500]PKK35688.1 dTDP-Rha--alpha-D-GlcNAc-pyrophosphate polyprenol alpha-3-L-rhamnosyltransferase [Siphonobacter sp. SORGH_AS_0500]
MSSSASLPKVSIVTINYNQAEVTRQFLESSRFLTYPNYEIVIVDNASKQVLSTVLDVSDYPGTRIVRSEENLGFTGGNNIGMAAANGDYFFIVNNDTEMPPSLLDDLLKPFATDPRIGVTCPKIKFFDYPDIVQYAGYNPMNPYTGTATPIGLNEKDEAKFDQSGVTSFAHGCAMLVKREVIEKVGRFAERFFLYYEELDWSQRIKDGGFLIYYVGTTHILHKESVSVGPANPLKTYYLTRNRILYIRRHGSWFQRMVFYGFFAFAVLPKHLLTYLIQGKMAHAKAFMKGVSWNLHSPSTSAV